METNRLIIDKIKATDKYDYFINISNDKKVLETFICTYCNTIEELDFNRYINSEVMFAIRLKETGKLIGIILYCDETEDSLEVGYGIGSKYWNNGYVSEALKIFIEYLFETKNINTIYASFFKENIASKRVMEKCGMSYDHLNINELTYLDKERDLIYYSIKRY